MPFALEATEHVSREIANRTRVYFFSNLISVLLDRYVLNFDSIADHMYRNYGICIVLEDYLDLEDAIGGPMQIYEKFEIMRENEEARRYQKP
jgi:hypothetical protein